MNTVQLKKNINLCLDAKLVPLVVSSPGQGKSELIKEVAEDRDMFFMDMRLAQMEAIDLNS